MKEKEKRKFILDSMFSASTMKQLSSENHDIKEKTRKVLEMSKNTCKYI